MPGFIYIQQHIKRHDMHDDMELSLFIMDFMAHIKVTTLLGCWCLMSHFHDEENFVISEHTIYEFRTSSEGL